MTSSKLVQQSVYIERKDRKVEPEVAGCKEAWQNSKQKYHTLSMSQQSFHRNLQRAYQEMVMRNHFAEQVNPIEVLHGKMVEREEQREE